MPVRAPLLIFDGDCGFCTWIVDKIRRWIRPRVDIVAWQLTDLDELELTVQQCSQAVQFIDVGGSHSSGARVFAAMLRVSPVPWPAVGMVIDLPGISLVADRAYKLIAANRYKLPGATPACQIAAA